jgi:hypothetical protein
MGEAARKFEWAEEGCLDLPMIGAKQPSKQPLNNLEKWIGAGEVEALSSVSQQAVNKALRARRWRGADLMVREVSSHVGQGGKVLQVHVDSLPADLRTAWYLGHGIQLHARVDAATGELRHVAEAAQDPRFDERQLVARWRLDVIRQVVAKPKGSPERRALLEAVAAQEWRAPDGKLRQIGRATLYAWVAAYDAGGLIGLLPDERKDRGIKRVLVSTAWDGFFAGRIAPADHAAVAEAVVKHIRSLWASGESGWRAICEKSTTRLIELTLDLRDPIFRTLAEGRPGDRAGAPTRFGICDVNRRMAEAQRSYGIIAVRNKDNARFQDTIAPTIRRDYSLLSPREIVVGDVHPTDVMVLRPDGSRAYPKAISWFDPATCEVHMTIVLLEKGEGVRREHVAMAFEAMVHEWGLPKLLYLDNGSEYGWAEMINGFTQLSKLAGLTVKEHGGGSLADARVAEAREAVVRSLAYNAKGKPGIEGTFGVLEQVFFSNLLGWTAGERMRKKTHAKGRDPIPFNGDMAAFMGQVGTALEWYHKRPQHGRLAGRSPNEVLRSHIDAGWGKVVLAKPEVLGLAFSTEETRVVDRGCVSFTPRDGRSQRYFCEELLARPGEKITIRIPAYDPQYLFCFAADGELIGMAHPERQYSPLDPAGAHEVAARGKFLRRHITERSRHVALLDLVEETARHIGHLPAAPEMPVAAVVDAGMLDRMARVDAEARARLAAPDAGPRRSAPSQWKSAAPNAALQAVQFEDDEEEV